MLCGWHLSKVSRPRRLSSGPTIGDTAHTVRPKSCTNLPFFRYRPLGIPNPADAGCNSDLAQHSNTPTRRAAGFEDEDDDEDENEAPCKHEIFALEPCHRA